MKKVIVVGLFILLASGYAWSSGFIGGGFFNMDFGTGGTVVVPPVSGTFAFNDTGGVAFKDTGGMTFVDY